MMIFTKVILCGALPYKGLILHNLMRINAVLDKNATVELNKWRHYET